MTITATCEPETPKILTAYEKAASEGIDPRCIPQHLETSPPIGQEIVAPSYTDAEHGIWQHLFERQMALLPGRASKAYLEGVTVLGFHAKQLPPLRDLSEKLFVATGWQIARIPGLLHPTDFFELLSRRVFPCTDYIREASELDYTPAPDCFHDIFGHLPMITNPHFANFYQDFGRAALRATPEQQIGLERLHWFCVEFGLVQEEGGRRIFGAGVLSSKEEVLHALSDEVTVLDFDPDRIVAQDYQVWHLQNTLFTHASYAALEAGFRRWCSGQNLL